MSTKVIQGSNRIDIGKNNVLGDSEVALTVLIMRGGQGVARVEMSQDMVTHVLRELGENRASGPVALKSILDRKKNSLVVEDHLL